MTGFRLTVWLALFISPVWVQAEEASARHVEIFAQVDAIVAELAEMTGLEMKRPVDKEVIGREDLKAFLEARVAEEIKPEEIRIESLLLKKFGFVPAEFELKETMIELYTEQAAAFYDFHKKRLFMLDSGDDGMQETALVHELAHALADQHFPLEKYLDAAGLNDDGAMARMAVMEGQATWLMSEFMMRKMGRSLVDSPDMVDVMSSMIGGSSGEFPVFGAAPLYIKESLIFPYTSGMKFQQKVVEKHGNDGFAVVFREGPSSTRQILHPGVYFEPDKVEPPALPEIRKRRRYKELAEGTIGEFDYAVMLSQYSTEAAVRRIGPAWRAGSYRFLEHKKDKDSVLLQATRWRDAEAAADFAKEYRGVLEKKWKRMEVAGEAEGNVNGTGDDGYFAIRLQGTDVYIAEGLRGADEIRRWPQPRRRP